MQDTGAIAKNIPLPKQFGTELLVLDRGEGAWLFDSAGKKYLDFAAGIAVNSFGYGREDIARAVYEQMLKLPHTSNYFTSAPTLALGRALVASGPFAAVHFGNSGSEANESALKYARLYAYRTKGKGHEKLLCFSNAFHGRTMGALSCTPNAKYQDPFAPLIPGVAVTPFNDVKALEKTLNGSFAGVIGEVIQGEGGLAAMTPEFIHALNTLCQKHDAILIADEVQTGLGRTGSLYASFAAGLKPDIVTLAKPIAGGLPLSATLLPAKVNDVIHAGEHGTTFGGGPVTTAVALKVWEAINAPGFLENVRRKGAILQAKLADMKKACAKVAEVRGRGMLIGIEYLGKGDDDVAALLTRLRDRGLLALRSGANVLRIAPPLVISEEEIDIGMKIIMEALS